MAIQTATISIRRSTAPVTGGVPPMQLIEAMARVAESRATRELIRNGERADIKGYMFLPMLQECRVDAAELGRAMRKVWRAALKNARAGDQIAVEPRLRQCDILIVAAGPIAEMRPSMAGEDYVALPG